MSDFLALAEGIFAAGGFVGAATYAVIWTKNFFGAHREMAAIDKTVRDALRESVDAHKEVRDTLRESVDAHKDARGAEKELGELRFQQLCNERDMVAAIAKQNIAEALLARAAASQAMIDASTARIKAAETRVDLLSLQLERIVWNLANYVAWDIADNKARPLVDEALKHFDVLVTEIVTRRNVPAEDLKLFIDGILAAETAPTDGDAKIIWYSWRLLLSANNVHALMIAAVCAPSTMLEEMRAHPDDGLDSLVTAWRNRALADNLAMPQLETSSDAKDELE